MPTSKIDFRLLSWRYIKGPFTGLNRHGRRMLKRVSEQQDRIKRLYPKGVPGAFGVVKPGEED